VGQLSSGIVKVVSIEETAGARHTRFRANEPRIVHETIDSQALIMDMAVGTYFSCDGVSSVAWNVLVGGATPDELAAWLCDEHGTDRASADRDVAAFVGVLVDASVVVDRGDLAPDPAPFPSAGSDRYDGLAVEQFTDLADLILLDPVHDVTEAGWPHAPQQD
jgi:hypothetical protein